MGSLGGAETEIEAGHTVENGVENCAQNGYVELQGPVHHVNARQVHSSDRSASGMASHPGRHHVTALIETATV